MTKDEALRLALEALEELNETNSYWWQEVDEVTTKKIDPAITAIKAALEAKDEPVAIKWEKDADKECRYNNWVGITPFGKILITWKGWKEYHDACVDEFPGGFEAYGLPDDVKAACEVEYLRRLYTTLPKQEAKDEPWEQFYPEMGKPKLAYLPPTAIPENACYSPPQRTWIGLTDEDYIKALELCDFDKDAAFDFFEAKLKELNT